jgi:crotonobetainyl-CoA:carnitine CoA-transferase CaiB-like acyl-CoA transferase
MGMSIADQSSGQFTALAILAALTDRERSGFGRIVDIAMCDAIAWLTQLAWPNGQSAIGACARWQARDGWIAVAAREEAVRAVIAPQDATARTRAELVDHLARHGIQAAPVLEPAEVFAQPVIRDRRSIHDVVSGDDTARILAMPFGLTATPAVPPQRMHVLGEDNAALLHNQPTRRVTA